MSLSPGTKLAHYEIIEPIGKGGMGEVYRARDGKLDRDVAIKVLPEEFARDKERLARFEREAKLLASLNHPNIASIYGLEESDGVKALVLELVEGPTLAERIAEGPIPIEEALPIARQMAEALEAGHEAGVIHRDVKPANVKIRQDGTVKVLDYGLAKALEGEATGRADSELSQSPTLTRKGTQIGVILGTAAYMSPEQAKGIPVDTRSDLFSFGCVLFEMLTGRRAFQGELAAEILASIINREPDANALPANLHPRVRELLERCFEKEPKKCWQAAGDMRVELERALANPDETRLHAVAVAAPPGAKLWLVLPWVIASIFVTGVATWIPEAVRASSHHPLPVRATAGSAIHGHGASSRGRFTRRLSIRLRRKRPASLAPNGCDRSDAHSRDRNSNQQPGFLSRWQMGGIFFWTKPAAEKDCLERRRASDDHRRLESIRLELERR